MATKDKKDNKDNADAEKKDSKRVAYLELLGMSAAKKKKLYHPKELVKSTFLATRPQHFEGVALCATITETVSMMAVAKANFSIEIFAIRLHEIGQEAYFTIEGSVSLNGHKSNVHLACFAPNAQRLITCSDDFDMRLWCVRTLRCESICPQTNSRIRDIGYGSSHSAQFATVDDAGNLTIWKVEGGHINSMQIMYQESSLTVCMYHPNHKYIVTASATGRVRIWDKEADKFAFNIDLEHNKRITALAFSSFGNYMVAGFEDGLVFVWNVIRQQVLRRISHHTAAITSVSFSLVDSCFAVGSQDSQMSVWNVTLLLQIPSSETKELLVDSRNSECGAVQQIRFVSVSHLMGVCLEAEEEDKAEEGSALPELPQPIEENK